jgi:hypothetical protein
MYPKTTIRPDVQEWYATFRFGTRLPIGLDRLANVSAAYVIVKAKTRLEAQMALKKRFGAEVEEKVQYIHSAGQFTDDRKSFYPHGPCAVLTCEV